MERRQNLVKAQLLEQQLSFAATAIQRVVRGHLARKQYKMFIQKRAELAIQQREFIRRQQQLLREQQEKEAALELSRIELAAKEALRQKALAKKEAERVAFIAQVKMLQESAACTIQCWFRSTRAKRVLLALKDARINKAAATIQMNVRSWYARLVVQRLRTAKSEAIRLNRERVELARSEIARLKAEREAELERQRLLKHEAERQRQIRCANEQRRLACIRAAIIIQTAFKTHLARRELHNLRLEKRALQEEASKQIQKMARGYLARRHYKVMHRNWLERRSEAATVIAIAYIFYRSKMASRDATKRHVLRFKHLVIRLQAIRRGTVCYDV